MNRHRATWTWMLGALWPAFAWGASPERIAAEIDVFPQVIVRDVGSQYAGALLLPSTANRDLLQQPAVLARVKELGVKTVCFPAGCVANTYNWMAPSAGQMSVDEFLDFCDTIGADACYVLNLQGGTLGLEGGLPGDAPFEERIRHRHPAPEGCDGANAHYGTLDETLALMQKHTIQRALAGKRPLMRFVFGHEPWRSAKADWRPEVYSGTCEAYARTMLQTIIDYNEREGGLEGVMLAFVGVGYPATGPDPGSARADDQVVAATWTKELSRLAGMIDAVQQPLPASGDWGADAPARMMRLLTGIIAQHGAEVGEDLGGADEEDLGPGAPIEWTAGDVPRANAPSGFERQLADADALGMLMGQPTARVNSYYLIGDDPRALLNSNGNERDAARVFRLLAGRIGEQLVGGAVETNAFDLAVPAGEGVPALSVTTTRHGAELYILLVNRSADRPVAVRINLRGCTVKPEGDVRTLSAKGLTAATIAANNPILHTVPAFSAEVIHVALDQVIQTPLLADAEMFGPSVRVGEDPPANTFTLSTKTVEMVDPSALVIPAQPVLQFSVHVDADWLSVAPAAGTLSSEAPQEIEVAYRTARLPPGKHTATITVQSPDAYNGGAVKLRVDLTVRAVRADFDSDGDVDGDDFAKFAACMAAPAAIQAGPDCVHARLNGDDRVDMDDYYLFESCFSGPDRRPGQGCAE